MFGMRGTYKDRKVDRYDGENGFFVSTALVTDSRHPYETAVKHQAYSDGDVIIVEMYDSKEKAQRGHDRWIERMTAAELPLQLIDVSMSMTADLCDLLDRGGWRGKERETKA